MDSSLLQMFVDAVRGRLTGSAFGPVRWLRPLLVLPVGDCRNRRYLVVILETPGPFCYLAEEDPLDGVDCSLRFPQLTGAAVLSLDRRTGERVLEIRTETAGETGEQLLLQLLLFGSLGRAELRRGDTVIQFVGGRKQPGTLKPALTPVSMPAGPLYLVSRGRPGRVTPTPEDDPSAPFCFGPFDESVAACRTVGDLLVAETRNKILSTQLKPLTRRLLSRENLLTQLRSDLERAGGDHEQIRRGAETLAAYQSQIKSGVSAVDLADVYNPETTLHIELDPAVPVATQIQKRFKLASKLERSKQHTERRINEIGSEIDSLRRTVSDVEAADSFAAALETLSSALNKTRGIKGPRGQKTPVVKPDDNTGFRRFELDDMWFVLVGRNNRENDELTFHAAAPTDLWFHAQHVPGSHVVLKTRGNPGAPPARILEQTAAVAAFHSKARHSGLVPVIYTLRKFVRKPRGARAGQVVCEREKMIVVAPALPPKPGDNS
jgi:hypothetical protein